MRFSYKEGLIEKIIMAKELELLSKILDESYEQVSMSKYLDQNNIKIHSSSSRVLVDFYICRNFIKDDYFESKIH
jgi:hypothetical protein